MSITDELREWASVEVPYKYGHQLTAIADRIDAEHEAQLNDAFETRNSDENLESDGWMRLPKDADGEYIHVGDVMEGTCPSGKHVSGEVLSIGDDKFWLCNVQFSLRPDYMRHHHVPTVDDVLREFGRGWHEQMNAPETFDIADYVEQYAAKLQLREDA